MHQMMFGLYFTAAMMSRSAVTLHTGAAMLCRRLFNEPVCTINGKDGSCRRVM